MEFGLGLKFQLPTRGEEIMKNFSKNRLESSFAVSCHNVGVWVFLSLFLPLSEWVRKVFIIC